MSAAVRRDSEQPIAGSPAPHGGFALALLMIPVAAFYALLLTNAGTSGPFGPVTYGLTFNSMLLHLLQGRFDVDPAIIGAEGFTRDGAVYSYFGILPALLRVIALPLKEFASTDFGRLSCLVGVTLMAWFKLLAVRAVYRQVPNPTRPNLLPLMSALILISGAQIQFLRASIYVEALIWASALAAAFLYLVICGWCREGGFTAGLLSLMAFVAGLCLLTRVSTALGLYLALGFVGLWQVVRGDGPFAQRLRLVVVPAVILLVFAAAAGFINYERWGNPLVFTDLSRNVIVSTEFPERLAHLRDYGEFNIARLGYGLGYYFFPIWFLHDASGQVLWSDFVHRAIDSVELPPSSFFLSDPLLLGLAVWGAVACVKRSSPLPHRGLILLAVAGLAVPAGLMLVAIGMTFRYRLEFYPAFELLALIGFWRALTSTGRATVPVFAVGTAASVVAACGLWFLYMLSPSGPADHFLGPMSIVQFYAQFLP